MTLENPTLENAQDYYGNVLEGSVDLKTDACATIAAPPPAVRQALGNVHPEVKARYYGCGLVFPQAVEGCQILDLGSGAGQDAYIMAQLVGEHGSVTGVDATRQQLEIANRHLDWHRKKFGYAKSNVTFVEGDIEKLGELGLAEGSFDVIISNCVINLVNAYQAHFIGVILIVLRKRQALTTPAFAQIVR
jgi:arsenite methyltransferase